MTYFRLERDLDGLEGGEPEWGAFGCLPTPNGLKGNLIQAKERKPLQWHAITSPLKTHLLGARTGKSRSDRTARLPQRVALVHAGTAGVEKIKNLARMCGSAPWEESRVLFKTR